MYREAAGIETTPLPDYVVWLQRAELLHTPPWTLFDDGQTPPPRWWWVRAADIYFAAKADAERARAQRAGKGTPQADPRGI